MKHSQWHNNWLLDLLLRVGFIAMLAWVLINLVLRLVPEEGTVLTITTRAVPSSTPFPE